MSLRIDGNRPTPQPAPVTPAARASQSAPSTPAAASTFDPVAAKPTPSVPDRAITAPSTSFQVLELDSPAAQTAVGRAMSALSSEGLTAVVGYEPRSVTVDALGMTHVRMDRTLGGQKVFGEQVVASFGRDGQLASVFGDDGPVTLVPSRGAISTEQAVASAQAHFGLTPEEAPKAEKVLVPDGNGQYTSAYHVELQNLTDGAEPMRQNYLIDAESGEILETWNQIDPFISQEDLERAESANAAAASSPGSEEPAPLGDDTTKYYGQVDIGGTLNEDGTAQMSDPTRGNGVIVRDANNQSTGSKAEVITGNDLTWGDEPDSDRIKNGAVDAAYGAQTTYDFYNEMFGRDSIDGKGEALVNNVHVRNNYVNAFWDGKTMNYGDGDGKTATVLTSLDVAGHEITHGLTERTAGLIYRGQSGGLNEAMSDILGKGVEWFAAQKNPDVKFSWGVGETIWTPGTEGDALRYMDDPSRDGRSIDHFSKFKNQDVHYSSGIANNAFTLLVQGGTNKTSGIEVQDGIGMEKGQQIFFRALTTYMTPNTTFAQARAACVQAATDLYGADSVEVQKVKESWTAVGVE